MDTNINTEKKEYLLPASILIAGVIIAAAVIYSNGLNPGTTGQTGGGQQANNQKEIAEILKVKDNDAVMGNANAPVTVVLYSDPSCPFCAAAAGKNQEVIDYLKKGMPSWTPPVPGIIENYVKTGKARLVFRYFPGHGTGEEATKAMFCANEQGKFWELHDKVFENQNVIEDMTKIRGFAGSVGVNLTKLDACLASNKYAQKLQEDTSSGQAVGVDGTPAFYINGQKIEAGAQPFSELKTVIDKILAS
ncbi:MAG: thioredoxin domain-containing protein [Candidatus Pacebacteria bacterium]|nr:thioredoxin domain-containing protein [Candidatus Paceibacterota bacterium]